MKNNNAPQSTGEMASFHAVDYFRGVKAQIAKETWGMTFEEFKQYLAQKMKNKQVQKGK